MANTKHVAVIIFPFSSHPEQVLNVTRSLATAAPDITFSFLGTVRSNTSLFGSSNTCDEFDNINIYNMDDGIPENHVYSGSPLMEEIDLFIKAIPGNLKKAIEKAVSATGKKITCVVSDAFVWMSGIIAEELAVPWISVWISSASSFSCHYYTDLIRHTIKGENNKEPLSCIPGMSWVRPCDLPQEIYGDTESGFAQMLYTAGLMMPRSTAIVTKSIENLESAIVGHLKSKLKLFLPMAPCFTWTPSSLCDPHNCISWLDGQKPSTVTYISFGTITMPPPKELDALAQGLEASGLPFLWSLKDDAKIHLPCGFLDRTVERGKVVPWTPQREVLQHAAVGVYVTHCGWGSLMESISGGVPIICRPFFADQLLNRRLVSHVWEIGIEVGGGVFTKDETMKALDLILRREQGKHMKDRVEALRKKVKLAIEPNGNSTKNFDSLLQVLRGRQ